MLLYISILTFVLSAILAFYNWKSNKNALYLSLFFIILSTYSITHYFSLYGKSSLWLAIFYYHFSPLWLLLGPLLYFYVNGTLSDRQGLRWKDAWHFIPAIIHLVNISPYYLISFSYKIHLAEAIITNLDVMKNLSFNLFYSAKLAFIARPLFLLAYVIYAFKILWSYNPNKLKNSTILFKQYLITYRWLFLLLTTVLIITANFVLIYSKLISQTGAIGVSSLNITMHYITGIVFFALIGSLLLFPQILYGIPISQQSDYPLKKTLPNNSKASSVKEDIIKDSEKEEPFNELALLIKNYMENEKPYLDTNFSITSLSNTLKAPQHHILYCFNNILKLKFTDFRTSLRIDYAKEILLKGEGTQLSMEGVSFKSGFSSRSSFYIAFKAATGFTPGEFILNHEGKPIL